MTNDTRSYDHEVIKLLRENLKGIGASFLETKLESDLTKEGQLELYRFSHMILSSPYWKVLLKEIYTAQSDLTVMKAANYEQATFGRATINGSQLLDELLTRFNKKFEENSAQGGKLSEAESFKILTKVDGQSN